MVGTAGYLLLAFALAIEAFLVLAMPFCWAMVAAAFALGWVLSFLTSLRAIQGWQRAARAWRTCAVVRGDLLGMERPPNEWMTHFRFRYRGAGPHIVVRVYTSRSAQFTFAFCGELRFRESECDDFLGCFRASDGTFDLISDD